MFAKQLIKKLLRYPTREIFTRSYSQEGEDLILKSMFEDRGRGHKGFYVDVGALHPYRLSNTAFFYEKGWSGINIEPTPTAIELFKKHRPRDINLNLGVGNGTAELTFYCFDEPALNSFSKELSEERHNTSKFKITGEVKIPISPLSVILDEHLPKSTEIDFMSIDVEGLDLDVLKSNNWNKYSPAFLLVEDFTDLRNINASAIYQFVTGKNYQLKAKTERTLIFERDL